LNAIAKCEDESAQHGSSNEGCVSEPSCMLQGTHPLSVKKSR